MIKRFYKLQYFIVDAFAERVFTGNPAAVFILEDLISDDILQEIASEMNLSETAYLFREKDIYSLRWFSPVREVDLCGHATLASAHVLWEKGMLGLDQAARFSTKSGTLVARNVDSCIEMDFPPDVPYTADCPAEIIDGLKIIPVYTGKSSFDYFIEVGSEDIVRNIVPDIEIIKKVDCRGIIVTSTAKSRGCDFVSRFFAPRFGIPEDPVTGSAHCALGPYWSVKLKRSELAGYQASKRGGVVKVKVTGHGVVLGGKAKIVAAGEFFV